MMDEFIEHKLSDNVSVTVDTERSAISSININTEYADVSVTDVNGFGVESEQGTVFLSTSVHDMVEEYAKKNGLIFLD